MKNLLFRSNKNSLALRASWAVLAAASLAQPARAQQAPGQAATADSGSLQAVVVTAQRVENDLQKTPVSVTALSSKAITQQNILSTTDLRGIVPDLEILPQGGGGAGAMGQNEVSVAIRGVGSAARFFNEDPSVGIYQDNVYLSSSYNLNLGFYDLADVQVLKGPQGTLFGKNTIGGALLLDTKGPQDSLGGYAKVTYGSFNRLDGEGAVNLPINDQLSARLSFFSSDVDGYINHVLDSGKSDDIHEKDGRIQLRYKPTDRVTVDLEVDYGASHDHGNAYITTAINPNAYYLKNYNAVNAVPYQTAYPVLGQPYTIWGNNVSNFPYPSGLGPYTPFDQGENGGVNLRIAWELADNLTLKSITAYRDDRLDSYRTDGTPGGLYTEFDQYRDYQTSQEFQLISKLFDGRLNLVGGLFYINQVTHSAQITGPDYVDPVGYYYVDNQSFPSVAGYAQGTFKVTDKLSLTAGIRYTYDDKASSSIVWTSGCSGSFLTEYTTKTGGCWVPGPNGNTYSDASKSWQHADPHFEADYQWTPDLLTYASVTSGYQSGGFNPQNSPGAPLNVPFQQETIWNYEGGVKSEWFDHRLRVNGAVFYQKFYNYQSSVQTYYNGVDTTITTSAADAHEQGVELEVDAKPIRDLGLHATFAHLEQGYDKIFPGAVGLTESTAINSAPKYEYSLAADYTFHVGGGALVPALNWRWVGTKASGTPPAQTFTPPYGLLGANITYTLPDRHWSLSAWGNNLLNQYYYVSYSSGVNTNMGLTTVTPGRPREVGVTLGYNF